MNKEVETKNKVEKTENSISESKSGFKSGVIKKLVDKVKSIKDKFTNAKDDNQIKDKDAISLSDIFENIETMTESDIKDICDDINKMDVKVGIDSKAIKFISEHKDDENVKKLLQNLKQSMNIDVNSIAELSSRDFSTVRSLCKIDKVYVNSGWDEAAKIGYSAEKYAKIRNNADKMIQKAFKNLPENASEEEKFMALYNVVLKAEHYDYQALDTKRSDSRFYTSRNLEGFFLHGRSVCAGTADALKNLCECAGLEAEYVQGQAKSRNDKKEYTHAWIKVNINGKWYNADPTWDANKAGKPYEYCLKSDEEFTGHRENHTYNPTYKRGGNVQKSYSNSKVYRKADKSMSRSSIKEYCDSSIVDMKRFTPEEKRYVPTEKDLEYMTKQQIPANVATATTNTISKTKGFRQKIAEFLNKSKTLRNISFIKKFIEKSGVKVPESTNKDVEKIGTTKSRTIDTPEVSKEQANSYLQKAKESAKTIPAKTIDSRSDR